MREKSIEVLISTTDRKNLDFLQKMNLATDGVVVNQNLCVEGTKVHTISDYQFVTVNSLDRGLSKSRNLAIEHSTADICLIADDDMRYHSDYAKKIAKAYEEHPSADIIAFQVKRVGNVNRKKSFREKQNWENYLTSMKISSVEITFRREVIVKKNISFNPNIGAGTEFYNGEENAFLYEALRKNCKILYLPVEIAIVDMSESGWFEGYTKKYFEAVGAKFYNMTKKYYNFLILQFAIRKYKMYREDLSLMKALKYMREGVKKFKSKNS